MKLLHRAVFVLAASFSFTLFAFAQLNQATPDRGSTPNQTPSVVQPIAPPQIGTPAKPEQKPFLAPKLLGRYQMFVDPADPFRRPIIKKLDNGIYLAGSQTGDGSFDGGIYTTGQPRSPGDFDGGIYLKKRAGKGTCGAILSYNFSPGENPSLQSVTTCTPANPEAPLRTEHQKQPGPPAPQLRKAVIESGPPQP
jgi:hypothetical protein